MFCTAFSRSILLSLAFFFGLAHGGDTPTPLARMYGDPHFEGFDGIRFDFTGEHGASYCLLTDPELNINMEMVGYEAEGKKGVRTWVRAIGVLSGGHSIELRARGGPSAVRANGYMESIGIDGNLVKIPRGRKLRTRDGQLSFEFLEAMGKEGDEEVERYELTTRGGFQILIKLKPESAEVRRDDDALIHFSVEVVNAAALSDVHGVMGQSFRSGQKEKVFGFQTMWSSELGVWQVAGLNGEGYLEGGVEDYRSSDLLEADCRFSRYAVRGRKRDGEGEESAAEAGESESEDGVDSEGDHVKKVGRESRAKRVEEGEVGEGGDFVEGEIAGGKEVDEVVVGGEAELARKVMEGQLLVSMEAEIKQEDGSVQNVERAPSETEELAEEEMILKNLKREHEEDELMREEVSEVTQDNEEKENGGSKDGSLTRRNPSIEVRRNSGERKRRRSRKGRGVLKGESRDRVVEGEGEGEGAEERMREGVGEGEDSATSEEMAVRVIRARPRKMFLQGEE